MHCSCMATAVTLILCLKRLPLQFLRRPTATLGRKMCTTSGAVGKKVACVCRDPPTLHLYPMQLQAVLVVDTLWGGCAFCPARGGVTRNTDRWVHHHADRGPTTPPIVGHGNGRNTAPVVQTSARPKKQCKVRSRADTSVPTTTRISVLGVARSPLLQRMVYLSEGDSTTEERYTKNDPTPRLRVEGTGLRAWMDDRHTCAYQVRCIGEASQGPGQRPWLRVIT